MQRELPESIAKLADELAAGPSPEQVRRKQAIQTIIAGGSSPIRFYHVVVINERTGQKFYMTETPVTHSEGCTMLSKLTKYEWRRNQLEEFIY
jgi:hypothetical protein